MLSPVYMIQPVVKPVVSCIQTFNRLSNPFDNPTVCIVYTAGCQTGITTQFDNRFNEQWLFVQHSCQTGFDNWLDVCLHDTAGCQTGFDNRLYRVNGYYKHNMGGSR